MSSQNIIKIYENIKCLNAKLVVFLHSLILLILQILSISNSNSYMYVLRTAKFAYTTLTRTPIIETIWFMFLPEPDKYSYVRIEICKSFTIDNQSLFAFVSPQFYAFMCMAVLVQMSIK